VSDATVRFVRRAAFAVVAITGWLFVGATGTSIAQAGVWGSGAWPYLDGIVCTQPGETIPLVSWPLASVAGPAFLSAGIVDNDGIDSGRPPTGPPVATDPPVTPETGDYTAAQIAAMAYLISTRGADPSPARIAEVAEIVTEQGGAPAGEQCLATGQEAISTAEAQQMWMQAQENAGPYQVSLRANASTLVFGQAVALTATVTSALGYPVPDLLVTFSSTGIGSPQQQRTDAWGHASATLTVQRAQSVTSTTLPTLSASVSAPVGLRVRSAPGSISALYADAAVIAAGSLSLPLSQPTKPAISVTMPAPLALAGSTVATTVSVTGLNSFAANATVTLSGPLPPDSSGGCRTITAATWASAPVLSNSGYNFIGDGTIAGPSITGSAPGCYSTAASLTTINASPNLTTVTGYGLPAASVAVVPITVRAQAAPGAVAHVGPLPIQVTIDGTPAFSAAVSGDVLGPQLALGGSCDKANWEAGAASKAVSADTVVTPGSTAVAGPDLQVPGCYALQLKIVLTVGELGSISIDLGPGAPGTVALVLAPTITVNTATTWIDAGHTAHATVGIFGALTQPVLINTTLLWQPTQPLGCATADWARASVLGTSAADRSIGDGSYPVVSVVASKIGCYSLFVTVTLQANTHIIISAARGSSGSLFFVENPPAFSRQTVAVTPIDDTSRMWITLIIFGTFLAAATSYCGVAGWRERL
jgi:Bacterial Ig-like domain (group 1)